MADIIVVGADGIPVKAKDMGDGTFQIASQTTVSAGTSLMGKVGIDQTTPGVTNGVSVVGSLPNKLMEEVFCFNALAIIDITSHDSGVIDLTKYKQIVMTAVTTLNQTVTIIPLIDSYGPAYWNGTAWVGLGAGLALTSVSSLYMVNTIWTFLNSSPIKNIRMFASCTTAPTSGSLTVKIWGVLN